MTGITVKELLEATGGNLLHGQEDQHVKHISLDSRKMEGDDLFVPIVGERVDAHRFLCQAIASGAGTEVIEASARQAGLISLFEHGCMAIEQGLTTLEELLRVLGMPDGH